MKKQLFFLFTIASLIFITSCTTEQINSGIYSPSNSIGETGLLSFTVELETDDESTRAPGEPGFGNGNKINNLVYALYTQDSSLDPEQEGEIKPVTIGDNTLVRVEFYPSKDNKIEIPGIEIIKGIEYTLMLWAQYRPLNESEDKIYYDLKDDGIIRLKSYHDYHFPNNDEKRDVFCAIYKIVQYEDSRHLNLTLRRPFAQINIGAKKSLLKRANLMDEAGNLMIENSSVIISGDIANKYNLFKNIAEVEKDEEGETETFTRTFTSNTIPSKAEDNAYKNLIIKGQDSKENKEYIWLSMCYILPNGELGDVSEIDVKDFKLYDADGNEIDQLISHSFTGVPALRNRRTNIILSSKDFKDVEPWQNQPHTKLTQETFTSLIKKFYDQSSDYKNPEFLAEVERDFNDNIIEDEDDIKYIMLSGTTYENDYNILPVHRNYILYGTGTDCIIVKEANQFSYHNLGPVRNLVIQDNKGNYKIFIDEDGFVNIPNGNDWTKTEHRLSPLLGDNKSYDVTCSTGEVKLSTYYNEFIKK